MSHQQYVPAEDVEDVEGVESTNLTPLQRVALSGYPLVEGAAVDQTAAQEAVVRMLTEHARQMVEIGALVATMVNTLDGTNFFVPDGQTTSFRQKQNWVEFCRAFPGIWEYAPQTAGIGRDDLTILQSIFPY